MTIKFADLDILEISVAKEFGSCRWYARDLERGLLVSGSTPAGALLNLAHFYDPEVTKQCECGAKAGLHCVSCGAGTCLDHVHFPRWKTKGWGDWPLCQACFSKGKESFEKGDKNET